MSDAKTAREGFSLGGLTSTGTDEKSVGQIPPVGPHPTADVLFIGALLWSAPSTAANVLALVRDDDVATPSQQLVVAAIRRLVNAGTPPAPQSVLDELRRAGTLKHFAAKVLEDATTSGAEPLALPECAAAVVSVALRRRIESAGLACTEAAGDAPEDDLAPLVTRWLTSCLECSSRLSRLRECSS